MLLILKGSHYSYLQNRSEIQLISAVTFTVNCKMLDMNLENAKTLICEDPVRIWAAVLKTGKT